VPANAKTKTTFLCQDCGHTSPKWDGRCPGCGAWATYVEFSEPKAGSRSVRRPVSVATHVAANITPTGEPIPLSAHPDDGGVRMSAGMPDIDRLLGGGIVLGSVMLIAGDPGIGKSTLLLQVAARVSQAGKRVLYVSGEESASQVRLRAGRIGIGATDVLFASETSAEAVLALLERSRPSLLIVDSIQTLGSENVPSTPGSVAQVRECAQLLLEWAKSHDTPCFLAGHVTKDGNVAGPRVLEHMVDVVLYLEGEDIGGYRVLRCTKNRFGSTNDVALLEMRGDGLAEVTDPSAALISERQLAVPGSAIIVTLEGSRPLLLEVQALTNVSTFTPSRRSANGLDFNRMVMLTAVLTRRAGLSLGNQDIMVNVPGGLRINEPAADLGTALAIASSLTDRPLASDAVFVGEVGLNGEVRRVPQIERRLTEAARHGFKKAIIPANNARSLEGAPALPIVPVTNIREAIAECSLNAQHSVAVP
jgi:DNA repair protein RadA/Sms